MGSGTAIYYIKWKHILDRFDSIHKTVYEEDCFVVSLLNLTFISKHSKEKILQSSKYDFALSSVQACQWDRKKKKKKRVEGRRRNL